MYSVEKSDFSSGISGTTFGQEGKHFQERKDSKRTITWQQEYQLSLLSSHSLRLWMTSFNFQELGGIRKLHKIEGLCFRLESQELESQWYHLALQRRKITNYEERLFC